MNILRNQITEMRLRRIFVIRFREKQFRIYSWAISDVFMGKTWTSAKAWTSAKVINRNLIGNIIIIISLGDFRANPLKTN